jgi:hypothetical protein
MKSFVEKNILQTFQQMMNEKISKYKSKNIKIQDRLCGLVVTVPGNRSRAPGSVWNGVHSAS